MDDATRTRVRQRLWRWYRAHHRDLPWRRTRDPYHIWIAEIMLQQTRVDVVVPYYEAWLRRFPTVAALASAALDEVLQAWAGLGYYKRARSLHAAAAIVVEDHGGHLPGDAARLRQLPGIGRTTAGAIASLAFGLPEPILDANVARVLARTEALAATLNTAAASRRLWELAAGWARCRAPDTTNQALMELGATLCAPTAPRCPECPLAAACRAHQSGRPTAFPRRRRRPRGQRLELTTALLRRGDALLLVRRSGRLLRDFWETPSAPERHGSVALRRALHERCGVRPATLRRQGPLVQHGVLSHRLRVQIYTGSALAAAPSRRRRRDGPEAARAAPLANLEQETLEWRWVRPSQCRRLTLTTLTRKVLRAAATVDSVWKSYLGQDVGKAAPGERRHEPAQEHVD